MISFTTPASYTYSGNTPGVDVIVPPELEENDAMFIGVSMGWDKSAGALNTEESDYIPGNQTTLGAYGAFYLISFLGQTPPEFIHLEQNEFQTESSFTVVVLGIKTSDNISSYVEMSLNTESEDEYYFYSEFPEDQATVVPDFENYYINSPQNGATYLHWISYTEDLGTLYVNTDPLDIVFPSETEELIQVHEQRTILTRYANIGSALAYETYTGGENVSPIRQWSGIPFTFWNTVIVSVVESPHPDSGPISLARVASGVNHAYFITHWRTDNPSQLVKYSWKVGDYTQMNDSFDLEKAKDVTQSYNEDSAFVISRKHDESGCFVSHTLLGEPTNIIAEFNNADSPTSEMYYYDNVYVDAQATEDGTAVWVMLCGTRLVDEGNASFAEIWRLTTNSAWEFTTKQHFKTILGVELEDIAVSYSGSIFLLHAGIYEMPIEGSFDGGEIAREDFLFNYYRASEGSNEDIYAITVDRNDNVFAVADYKEISGG